MYKRKNRKMDSDAASTTGTSSVVYYGFREWFSCLLTYFLTIGRLKILSSVPAVSFSDVVVCSSDSSALAVLSCFGCWVRRYCPWSAICAFIGSSRYSFSNKSLKRTGFRNFCRNVRLANPNAAPNMFRAKGRHFLKRQIGTLLNLVMNDTRTKCKLTKLYRIFFYNLLY